MLAKFYLFAGIKTPFTSNCTEPTLWGSNENGFSSAKKYQKRKDEIAKKYQKKKDEIAEKYNKNYYYIF